MKCENFIKFNYSINENIIKCSIFLNLSSIIGGAIYIKNEYSEIFLETSIFKNCFAEDCGGAIRFSLWDGIIICNKICGENCFCLMMGQFISSSLRNLNTIQNFSEINCYKCSSNLNEGYYSITLKDSNINFDYSNSTKNFVLNSISGIYLDSFNSKNINFCNFFLNKAKEFICISFKGINNNLIKNLIFINNSQISNKLGLIFLSGDCNLIIINSIFLNQENKLFCNYLGELILLNCFINNFSYNSIKPTIIDRIKKTIEFFYTNQCNFSFQ